MGTMTNAYSTVLPIDGQKRSSLPDSARMKLSNPTTRGVPPMAYWVKLRYSDASIGPKTNRKKPSNHGDVQSQPASSSRARGLNCLRRWTRTSDGPVRSINSRLVKDRLQFLGGFGQGLLDGFGTGPDSGEHLAHRGIELRPAVIGRHLPRLGLHDRFGEDLVRLHFRYQPWMVEHLFTERRAAPAGEDDGHLIFGLHEPL